MSESVVYRKIQPTDLIPLKALHEEFFPVQYSDSFYVDACQGIGIRNGPLFTSIATIGDEIIGFVLAQFIPYAECEDNSIVESSGRITHLCYILTLGVKRSHRRSGIASTLLEQVVNYARHNKGCGVVYLHVLTTNQSAIKFYESNKFSLCKELYDFYSFLGGLHDAYLYALYINEFRPPWIHTFLSQARRVFADGLAAMAAWLQSLIPSLQPRAIHPVVAPSQYPQNAPNSPSGANSLSSV